MKIGLPKAMLYHRYKVMWLRFFEELGIETIVSPETDKRILDIGSKYGIDEACLSSKLLWGHIDALIGKCDKIFVPRYANYSNEGVLCTRFEALYDMAVNTFRDSDADFICLDVDLNEKLDESTAYERLAQNLGFSPDAGRNAYRVAYSAWMDDQAKREENTLRLLESDNIKVLVIGHSYNVDDEYIGIPIIETLRELKCTPILATDVILDKTRTRYTDICKDVPWMVNRELLGALSRFKDKIDGIILITAFPCGPDSMLNEMIIRRVKDKPILNLLLDSQDGNAGIETRLESFIDIIRFRKEAIDRG